MFHNTELTQLAIDLTNGLSDQRRYDRLLTTVRNLFHCDASTLLAFRQQKFVPLAIDGLAGDVMGRHFEVDEHPRLEVIARAGDIVRFPANSELADPFDGLIETHKDNLHVHACVGLPLLVNERLVGALTIDGFDPHQFDGFSDEELRTVSALAAASLYNALLIEQLEQRAPESGGIETPASLVAGSTEMIGQSLPMQRLKRDIELVAETDMTTLILGETGVGKELVAASVHERSYRSRQPMVYLNCAALPESVAESELFGHVKSAFTGAVSHRKGKFELADKGTLFLDEVGELSLSLQSKLLRVLQYGDLQRVGDDSSLKVDVRIIAATNRDLQREVSKGNFRSDLYHRLSVFPLSVPPLRDRGDDILQLAGFFLERFRSQFGLQHLSLSPVCRHQLLAYHWPGNVRELEHSIHRAVLLARASREDQYVVIQREHLGLPQADLTPNESRSPSQKVVKECTEINDLRIATEEFQGRAIRQALKKSGDNWAKAARQLSMDAGNLHRLAKRLGIK